MTLKQPCTHLKIKAYNERWKVLLNKYSLFFLSNTYASSALKHRCSENYRKYYYDSSSSTHFRFIKFICWSSMKLDFILESTIYVVKHAKLLTNNFMLFPFQSTTSWNREYYVCKFKFLNVFHTWILSLVNVCFHHLTESYYIAKNDSFVR